MNLLEKHKTFHEMNESELHDTKRLFCHDLKCVCALHGEKNTVSWFGILVHHFLFYFVDYSLLRGV